MGFYKLVELMLGKDVSDRFTIEVWQARISGLRKAGGALLSLYIKEIDVLTPAKLTAIRRMRHMLR